jgi:hypothetical protein
MDGRFASLAMYPTHPTLSSLSPRYCHCDQIQLLFFIDLFFLIDDRSARAVPRGGAGVQLAS